MSTFNEADHPRGHPTNPGAFTTKQHSAPATLDVTNPMTEQRRWDAYRLADRLSELPADAIREYTSEEAQEAARVLLDRHPDLAGEVRELAHTGRINDGEQFHNELGRLWETKLADPMTHAESNLVNLLHTYELNR